MLRSLIAAIVVATILASGGAIARADEEPAPAEATVPVSKRILRKRAIVDTTPANAYAAWTSSEGLKSWMGIESKIEPKMGGAFEWYFSMEPPAGSRGSEGCTVLAFTPDESLSFSWNAPPKIPSLRDSGAHTQVTVRFTALDPNHTRVDLAQSGFGEGADWEEYYTYFDRAWGSVLGEMKKHFDANLPPMKHWVYYVRPVRDEFLTAPTPEESARVSEHAAYIAKLAKQGIVRVAGPSFEPSYYPTGAKALPFESPAPGVVVFRAGSLEKAQEIMNGDPAVQAGVFKARLNEYVWAFSHE